MVSPAPSTAQKPPAVSYADRAKKARNINSQNPLATRPQPPPVSVTSPITPTPTALASPTVPPITSEHISKSGPSIKTKQQVTQSPPLAQSPPNANPPVSNYAEDSSSLSTPLTVAEGPLNGSTVPVVNVWNLRKEQMAQARATTQVHTGPSTTRSLGSQEVGSAEASTSTSNGPQSGATSIQRSSINGNTDVRHGKLLTPAPQASQTSVSTTIDDTSSWPTVGMSATQALSPNTQSNDKTGLGEERDEYQRGGEDDRNGVNPTVKKSEKPKWVPIPAEELQAAADANRPRSFQRSGVQSRSRSSHQHNSGKVPQGSKPASGSASNTGSVSGRNSQGQSRTHSAAGTPQSHSNSVSQSRAESRVGSVQSSPRQSSTRGGGRRLLDEPSAAKLGAEPVGSRNRSSRSSRAPSPHIAGRIHRPSEETLHVVTSFTPPLGVMDHIRSHPDVFYPAPPPLSASSSQPHSYHSTHASNSPSLGSYPLPVPPPNLYASPTPSYAGPPAYPMYPPYPYPHYGQPQPYMSWAPTSHGQPPTLYADPSHYHHSRSPSQQSGYSPALLGGPAVHLASHPEGIPPPTMMSRPPPPGQSEPVAGYREVGFFLPSPTAHTVAAEGSDPDTSRGPQAKELSFGTIKPIIANRTPSPPPQVTSHSEEINAEATNLNSQVQDAPQKVEQDGDKTFPMFSIGFPAGEAGPSRIRSKTHPKSTNSSHERGNTAPAKLEASQSRDSQGATVDSREAVEKVKDAEGAVTQVIDLTDSVTTPAWEFGTTRRSAEDTKPDGLPHLNGFPVHQPHPGGSLANNAPIYPSQTMPPMIPPAQFIPRMQIPPLPVVALNGPPPTHSPSISYPVSAGSVVSPSDEHRASDEWEVKNYGFGFGRGGGTGPLPTPAMGRADREFASREFGGKPRRGGYGGSAYERGERGGYSGRRARGANGGFSGRGYGGRNARGGYQGQSPRPPFSISQQPVGVPPDANFYTPPPQGTTYFHPLGYEYAPYPYVPVPPPMAPSTSSQSSIPVPTPQTSLSFPLDPTRYYLLGQLEYYLSAQNLAQDFYLRQRMDSRGWISIPLIASFNRIKQLTTDLQLVRDVLTLSHIVEVREDSVRVHSWQQYVLPDATPSAVEEDITYQSYAHPEFEEAVSTTSDGAEESASHDDGEEDISEEEVVFVMGK
ncbi:hypothetical protein BXZ70DRAFT_1009366 [Cristinia sonorae]|uniref:HTH La-type RNA-binding domain-containing protein n=1 Tax=Cristinia sonorae TaxID=1940300 RepID=A0A8K0XNM3_9AGAR|nr:hypothetical protein BXZ70DRAFT_1009366 [Cristinia sonorae]